MTERAVLVSIRGRVQGVGYRMWTARQARALGLRGWVRNEPDGSVAALVGGADAAVQEMLDLFWIGPSAAHVARVEACPADHDGLPDDFSQLR
ncbi:acylphosphatase [Mesorhizobium sp. ZMM04-5]|uniref:acylphosphatase n=1 Tax=Mesorhizobium marinum TaxID=3228790 RepID=A0ABV3R4G2_9HYPH